MKIDFSQELKTIEGDTLHRERVDSGKIARVPATLKWATVEALLSPPANANVSGEEKARRYDLAIKIQQSHTPLDLPVDDVSFIKKLCDEHFPPLVMGQTRKLLEGPQTEGKSD